MIRIKDIERALEKNKEPMEITEIAILGGYEVTPKNLVLLTSVINNSKKIERFYLSEGEIIHTFYKLKQDI